ncbi:MAG: hypothetical protein ACK5A0_06290 [Polaromonas sp.]
MQTRPATGSKSASFWPRLSPAIRRALSAQLIFTLIMVLEKVLDDLALEIYLMFFHETH